LKGKKLAVWGLAFKPNTDDMRSAPIIPVIKQLKEEGSEIIAYDPEAMEKAKEILSDISYAEDPYSMLKGCDGLIIATEWDIFKNADLDKIKENLNHPLIIDGRNIFDPVIMKEKGFEYISIGRPSIKK